MKVFVAGASGRVGNAVVSDLVKAGYEVVAGSRHPEGITETDGKVRKVVLDFHNPLGRSNRFLMAATLLYLLQGRAVRTSCRLTSMVLSK